MKNLELFNLDHIDNIVSPDDFSITTLESPALSIFTDFKHHRALVIESDVPAIEVMNLMQKAHVQMKIVVSPENDFLGIISTKELTEQKIIAEVGKGHVREEIMVKDLMTPRKDLFAFDYNQLKKSVVKDVINALQNNGVHHCLVVDRELHHIRGLISSSDIARKLHLPVVINTKTSFSKIFDVIHDGVLEEVE